MTEPEFFHRRPPDGFDASGWVDAALRAGMRFSIDDNGDLLRWEAMPEVDPGPGLAWRALCRFMDPYRPLILVEIRRRIEAGGQVEVFPDAENPTRRHVFKTIRGTPCLES